MNSSKILSEEEKDDFTDIIDHSGFRGLEKILYELIEVSNKVVLHYNLDSGSPQDLAFKKAEADGARKLIVGLQSYVAKLKGRRAVGGVKHHKK